MVKPSASTMSPCPRCRYDLAGLPPDSPCPECQLPAAAINSPMPIVIAEPHQIRRLAQLINVFAEILVIWTSVGLLFSLVGKAAGYGRIPFVLIVHVWGSRFAWLLMLCLILLIAWTDRSMLSPRSFHRTWWLVLSAIAAMFSLLFYALVPLWGWIPATVISVGVPIAGLAAEPLGAFMALYLRRIARRSDEQTLSRRFRLLMWLMVAEVALELFVSVVMRSWEVASSLYQVHWWIQFAFTFAYIALGLFAIRLARHLRGPALAEAIRVREHI